MKKIHSLKNLLRFGLLLCFALASFSCGSENDEKSKEAKTDTAGKTGTDTTSRNESHGHTHDHDLDEHHDEDDETGDALSGLLDGDLLKILGEYATIL